MNHDHNHQQNERKKLFFSFCLMSFLHLMVFVFTQNMKNSVKIFFLQILTSVILLSIVVEVEMIITHYIPDITFGVDVECGHTSTSTDVESTKIDDPGPGEEVRRYGIVGVDGKRHGTIRFPTEEKKKEFEEWKKIHRIRRGLETWDEWCSRWWSRIKHRVYVIHHNSYNHMMNFIPSDNFTPHKPARVGWYWYKQNGNIYLDTENINIELASKEELERKGVNLSVERTKESLDRERQIMREKFLYYKKCVTAVCVLMGGVVVCGYASYVFSMILSDLFSK
jgi:hypothetical protein